MFKKFVSIITVFAVLLAFTPVVAADTAPATPTVESILDEYQEKTFLAKCSGESATIDKHSSHSDNVRWTLEQETVNELNAAGYEAYNVTADNYKTIEKSLNTDLAELGITSDGSYIVVISGEDNSRYEPGFPSFMYTYEGVTYALRYVTVQADDSHLSNYSQIDLLAETGKSSVEQLAGYSLSVIGYVVGLFGGPAAMIGSSLLSSLLQAMDYGNSINETGNDVYYYAGGTNWTVVYTQVFNYDTGIWSTCASVEYAKMRYWFNHRFYDPSINEWVGNEVSGTFDPIYSEHYYDSDWRKEFAVLSYTNPVANFCEQDIIDYVVYKIGNEEKFRHTRGVENLQSIPGLN